MNQTGYVQGSGPSQGVVASSGGLTHEQLKKQFLSYRGAKNEEIKEQQDARRYYHGAQWTSKQVETFNGRRQPVVTYNRIGRKINAVVGLLERQRTDPKGYPRTPQHEEGAEIATAVLRYVCDEQEWNSKSPVAGLCGAVDGLGGIELLLEQGDRGDVEVGMEDVDPSTFFYDPRSLKMDFADARFMGTAKWADIDAAVELAPDKEAEIRASVESGSELTTNPDHEQKWFADTDESGKKIRIVDHWYLKAGKWHWCLYTGSMILAEGESPFVDEKGKTFCKYIMYSANVDHDGDRYGFVRNMRSSQDEVNQRRSKGLHILNSRRIIIEKGAYDDVETLRKEAARPDGVIEHPPGSAVPQFDDSAKGQELNGQLEFLRDAKEEIENYGFNPALMGSGVQDMSGRAIKLQQDAGIAELGPYLLAFKGWKLRVYRAIWNAIQRHWTSERWIRVTDDEQVAQFFAVNKLQVDPMTGQPTITNALGSLDVDVIIDEGPDTINMQADAYDTLSIMAQKGQQVPPEVLIELSPLAGSQKKKVMGMLQQAQQSAQQMQMPAVKAEMDAQQADTAKTVAETQKIVVETQSIGGQGQAEQQAKMMDLAGKQQDREFAQEKGVMDLELKKLDITKSLVGLEAARAAAKRPQGEAR